MIFSVYVRARKKKKDISEATNRCSEQLLRKKSRPHIIFIMLKKIVYNTIIRKCNGLFPLILD